MQIAQYNRMLADEFTKAFIIDIFKTYQLLYELDH